MGDRAPAQITIHATVPTDVPAILEFLEEWGLAADWGTTKVPEGSIKLNTTYGDGETDIGMIYNQALAKNAPNTAFTMWVDPKYEYPGDLEIHVPELGSFRASCDASGTPFVDPGVIMALLDSLGDDATVGEVRVRLAVLTGAQWTEAIEALGQSDALVAADWAAAAHRESNLVVIDEDSDRGTDIRWQAVCTAEAGDYACSWAGDWHRATDFVDQARRLNEPDGEHVVRRPGGEVDPGQLAFEAAEQDGREHLAQYGVASDGPTDASNEDASHGSPDREQAPQAAEGAAEGGS